MGKTIIFSMSIVMLCTIKICAQKLIIDSSAYSSWNFNDNIELISNDGKYVMCLNENLSNGTNTRNIQTTDGKWKKQFVSELHNAVFSSDSKHLLYIKGKDSLVILQLGSGATTILPGISGFQLQRNKNGEWICYRPVGKPANLILEDVKTKHKITYTDVNQWIFSEDGSFLLLWRQAETDPNTHLLQWVDMNSGSITKVCEGKKIEKILIDSKNKQLTFELNDDVWIYKSGSMGAVCIFNKESLPADKRYDLVSIDHFGGDGKWLFINVKQKQDKQSGSRAAIAEVWSYTNANLPTVEKPYFDPDNRLAVIDLRNNKVRLLDVKGGDGISFPISGDNDLALVNIDEQFYEKWSVNRIITSCLISFETGDKKKLDFLDGNRTVRLSPGAKFLIYYNNQDNNYFSYEIATGKQRNLTKGLDVSWTDINQDDLQPCPRGIGGMAWFKNDEAVLIYDRYDIWKLDPLNKNKPVNLTNGYAKRNEIVFNFAFANYSQNGVSNNDRIYLSAFSKKNKNNGFYGKQLGKLGDPELLTIGPYIYNTESGYVPYGSDFPPLKAKDGNVYIVRRMSATEAPNYFSTRDFKSFVKLTDAHPEKNYNWYTTELHTWKSLDGRDLQGILYKPQNFDSNKKYPLIFQYYERKSDGLNAYINPEPLCGGCNINLPTYVSQGYLVFIPDIYYTIGDPMQGTYDAVVSAANYVAGLPFVNAGKMGIQGCSFGGIQTNYLVTHTNLFAAAASTSGMADFVSAYGSIQGDGGYSHQEMFEAGQNRMGTNLWDKPERYIKSSPIFQVHRVTTPLLLMHTKKDSRCHFANMIEFFTGLRRMGKKSWMVVYSEGNHGIRNKEAEDFSIRMMQFFDHYLKDKPAPLWMLDSIPDSVKGFNNELQLDNTGRTPGQGLLTPSEQKKVNALMNREPVKITLK